jgi:cytoskeletal protein RodZ
MAPGGFVKKFQSFSFLATLAIAIGMISWGSVLQAQNTPSTSTPDQTTPQTQPAPSPEMPPASQQTPSSQTPSSQQPSSQSPDANAPQSGSRSSDAGASATGTDTQTFSGTVVKQGDKYMLKDDSGKMYDIDHQTDVAKFDGKRVRVQGTLDANGKILVK